MDCVLSVIRCMLLALSNCGLQKKPQEIFNDV